jgi:hypothetical protein
MPTVTTTARDQVTPALHKGRETLTDTVLPAVRTGLTTARSKGGDLLASDAAAEAKRRGVAVVKAARGEPIVTSPGRRWTFGLGMLALGGAIGAGALWVARRFMTQAPYEPMERTTFHEASTPDTMAASTTDGIDLRAGAPTTP